MRRPTASPDEQFTIGLGSVDEVREGCFPVRQAPLVVANILAPVIIRLFEGGLGELVSPGGRLILSGILREQAGDVIAAAEAEGLKVIETRPMEDWVAILCGK